MGSAPAKRLVARLREQLLRQHCTRAHRQLLERIRIDHRLRRSAGASHRAASQAVDTTSFLRQKGHRSIDRRSPHGFASRHACMVALSAFSAAAPGRCAVQIETI